MSRETQPGDYELSLQAQIERLESALVEAKGRGDRWKDYHDISVRDQRQLQQQAKAAQEFYDSVTASGPTFFSPNMFDKYKALGAALSASSIPVGDTCSSCGISWDGGIHTPECTVLIYPHQPETQTVEACPECKGTGTRGYPCGYCDGSGTLTPEETING